MPLLRMAHTILALSAGIGSPFPRARASAPLHQPQRAGPSSNNKAGEGDHFGLGPRPARRAEAHPRRMWLRCWGQNNQNERPRTRADGRQVVTGGGTG